MLQKKRRMSVGKKYFLGLIAAIGVVSALWCQSFVSLADSTGTVTADSANIREKADTNSEVIGSVTRGMTVSIRDEVQDSSGTLWYQIYVNANTIGYIHSDLVDKADGDTGSQSDGGQTASQSDTQSESSASGASVEPNTVLDAQYAVVTAEAIKVRTAPSTGEAVVDRLTRDAQVVVTGETEGNDGRKWYYVTFTGTGGAERTGYIRSDLLSLGDMVPIPEEVTPEPQEAATEPAEPMNYDYELTYEQDEDGSYAWYLYDYTEGQNGYRQRLQQLLDAAQTQSDEMTADTKTLVRQRVVIVILIALIVLLASVLVIMALKLRDVYYEDYEDEDEEEKEEQSSQRRRRTQEEEDDSTKRRRRTEEGVEVSARSRRRTEETQETSTPRRQRTEEQEEAPVRRRRRAEEAEENTERPSRRRSARDERESTVREVEYHEDEAGSAPVQTAPKRKAKNFLLDDDEFEFEFLNMDDKD